MNTLPIRAWYRKFYTILSGSGIDIKPWHFQYVSTFYLHRSLRRLLKQYGGHILDVGCGSKPYRSLFGKVARYIGLDIFPGEQVDVVVEPNQKWPFEDNTFDLVLCTQVLEHAEHLEHTLAEIARVVRPGGTLIASFPFIYNEHGEPNDYRRFSAYGAQQMFAQWEIQTVERQGGIGTTLTTLFLNWCDAQLSVSDYTRLLKGLLLPLWVPFSFFANLLGLLLDRIDTTNKFYSNVLIVARKPENP